ARVERHWHAAEVAELKRRFAAPAGIEQSGGAVHDDADAAETRAAFEATENVVIELQRFFGNGEGEFVRLKDEVLAGRHGDGAHQLLDGSAILQVDERVAAVLEDAELVTQAEIDRAASELLRGQGRSDLDLALRDIFVDVGVREDHRGGLLALGHSSSRAQNVRGWSRVYCVRKSYAKHFRSQNLDRSGVTRDARGGAVGELPGPRSSAHQGRGGEHVGAGSENG